MKIFDGVTIMILRIKNTFLLILFSFFTISSILPMRLPSAPGPMSGNGQMKLTKEDMELLEEISKLDEGELEGLWDVIMSEVDKMPEDQKQQFWSDVEQTAQMLEEEITKVIEEEQTKKEEEEAPVLPVVEPTPIIKTATDKDLKDVANLIGSLIDKIESYLRKGQLIPKFADKLEQWGKDHRISDWQAGATWNTLHADIDLMKSKLYLIGERDPKTNEYKHLQNILDDESLYNNLAQLNRKLDQFGPKISAPELGQQKLTKESKNAIEKVTSALTEALYVLKLPAAVDQVIKKYEKRAQELTKKQETAEKIAAKELKTPPPRVTAEVIGRREKFEFAPYIPETYGGFDGYTPPPPRVTPKKPTPTPKPKTTSKAPAKKKPAVKKEPAKKKEVPENPRAKQAIDSLSKKLDDADLTNINLINIDTRIGKAKEKDMEKAIGNAVAKIRRAAGSLNSIKKGRLKPAQKKKYYAEAKFILNDYSADLRRINSRAQAALGKAGELKPEVQELIDSINVFFSASRGF